MINKFKFLNKYIILIFLLIIIVLLNNYKTPLYFTNVEIIEENETKWKTNLPFSSFAPENKDYLFLGKIYSSKSSRGIVNIIPDDMVKYIKINNNKLYFSEKDKVKLSNTINGFNVNINHFLIPGENTFEIKIRNLKGNLGLQIKQPIKNKIHIFKILILILIALLFYYFLRNFKLDQITIILLIGGLIIRLIYLNDTNFKLRAHDVKSHIEYVRYIAANYNIPPANEGWEFFHPPFYYLTGVIVYKLSSFFGLDELKSLQILSLFYFFIFLIFSILILKLIIDKFSSEKLEVLFYSGVALLVFWPSGIFHSVRITNDIMLYMFYSIGFYFLLKWYYEKEDKNIYYSAIFTALAIMTKSSGIILAGITGIILLYELIKEKNKKPYIKKIIIISLLFTGVFSLNLWRNFNNATEIQGYINPSLDMPDTLKVGNDAYNYLHFDINTFICRPFTHPYEDRGGRQYFWNFFLKSSLFGEYTFSKPLLGNLAVIISWIFLIMLIFLVMGIILFQKEDYKTFSLLLLNNLCLFISIILFHIRNPFACCADFRLVFPMIISLIPLYIYTLFILKKRKSIALIYTGYIISYIFILLTILFFIFL